MCLTVPIKSLTAEPPPGAYPIVLYNSTTLNFRIYKKNAINQPLISFAKESNKLFITLHWCSFILA